MKTKNCINAIVYFLKEWNMKRTCALLAMLVSLGFTSSVEVGSQGFSNNMPFCAD